MGCSGSSSRRICAPSAIDCGESTSFSFGGGHALSDGGEGSFSASFCVNTDITHAYVGGVLYLEYDGRITAVKKWGLACGSPFIVPCGWFRHPRDFRVSCLGTLVLFSNPAVASYQGTPLIIGAHLVSRARNGRISDRLTRESFGISPSDSTEYYGGGIFDVNIDRQDGSMLSLVLVFGSATPGQRVLGAAASVLEVNTKGASSTAKDFVCTFTGTPYEFHYLEVKDEFYPRLMRFAVKSVLTASGKAQRYPRGIAATGARGFRQQPVQSDIEVTLVDNESYGSDSISMPPNIDVVISDSGPPLYDVGMAEFPGGVDAGIGGGGGVDAGIGGGGGVDAGIGGGGGDGGSWFFGGDSSGDGGSWFFGGDSSGDGGGGDSGGGDSGGGDSGGGDSGGGDSGGGGGGGGGGD